MQAEIDRLPNGQFVLWPKDDLTYYIAKQECKIADFYLRDGRTLSDEQRRKIFAIFRDIAEYSYDNPERIKEVLSWDFRELYDYDDFSLSPRRDNALSMSQARELISFLLDFCLYNGVPMRQRITDRTDDIANAMYLCLKHRKCAVCGRPADVHHIDSIGMGRDRERVIHKGLQAIALCRIHHTEAHRTGWRGFSEKYHVCGVKLDEYLCRTLGLKEG